MNEINFRFDKPSHIVLLILAIALVIFTFHPTKGLKVYADDVLEACSKSKFAPNCYDEEIPKLMEKLTLEEVLEVTRLVQGVDRRYLYCHVLGHKLSEAEMRKDPSKWKEVLSKAPSTFCNNGFLHGALIARFNSEEFTEEMIEDVKPDLKTVCEDRPDRKFVEVEKSMCYHAIGHLTMYLSNAEPKRAVELCSDVTIKEDGRSYLQTCTEGVFMHIFQPLEPEDFALVAKIAPKDIESARSLCSKYEGESYHACNRESWPLSRDDIMKPGGVERFCSYTNDELGERKCFAALMNMVTVNFLSEKQDFNGFAKYCDSQKKEVNQRRCFANAATRLIQIDPRYVNDSNKVCTLAKERGLEYECYRDLAFYGGFSFIKDSKERKDYCGHLPTDWQEACIEGGVKLNDKKY